MGLYIMVNQYHKHLKLVVNKIQNCG